MLEDIYLLQKRKFLVIQREQASAASFSIIWYIKVTSVSHYQLIDRGAVVNPADEP
jgi:hypothetical protein